MKTVILIIAVTWILSLFTTLATQYFLFRDAPARTSVEFVRFNVPDEVNVTGWGFGLHRAPKYNMSFVWIPRNLESHVVLGIYYGLEFRCEKTSNQSSLSLRFSLDVNDYLLHSNLGTLEGSIPDVWEQASFYLEPSGIRPRQNYSFLIRVWNNSPELLTYIKNINFILLVIDE